MSTTLASPAPQVHWYEGLFLEPHHLQILQRQILSLASGLRASAMPYAWGVVDAKLDDRRLESGRIRFERLHVVMPGGVELRVDATPETSTATLPELDVSDVFRRLKQPFTIALAVPRWQESYANAVDGDGGARVNRLWRVEAVEHRDENTGDNARAVEVRKANARLIIRKVDDETDLNVLPLLRITPAATDQNDVTPTVDRRFVPATMVLGGSATLAEMTASLLTFLVARREQLREAVQALGKMIPTQAMTGERFEKVMRLRVYDCYSARLEHLLARPFVTPSDVYLELRSLLAELASLDPTSPESARAFQVAKYDHNNPFLAFDDLHKTIRLLMPGQGPGYKMVPFRKEARYFLAQLEDKLFDEGNDFYLAVTSSGMAGNDVRKLLEANARFVLAAAKDFEGQRGFSFGIRLSMETAPIAAASNQFFFKIMKAESAEAMKKWRRVREDNGRLAAFWSGFDATDLQLAVCATLHGLDR